VTEPDRKRIGFDRTIPLEWLDAVVARVALGESAVETTKSVWKFLEDVEPGTTHNSGRGKTMTVLNRIWIDVPPSVESLKQVAVECISTVSGEQRVGIHWAMIAATHPFFFDVATHLGKLLKLNGHANRSQIKRRMVDVWGDRATLERTIQHVLKSMMMWGLLRSGPERGSLIGSDHRIIAADNVGRLLTHSVLLSLGQGLAVPKLIGHPSLFAFEVNLHASSLRESTRFRVHREGDQSDFVELA
jgi:hypothetical protein